MAFPRFFIFSIIMTFSQRVADLAPSPIRQILSVIDRPGMISFAGGLPAAESFPSMELGAVPQALLQYGASEGETALREIIAGDLRSLGMDCETEQVLILSGSQQGIDLVAKLFIDPGTPVALENPTYLAALQVFRFFGASFLTLDRHQPAFGFGEMPTPPAFTYVIPSFQNPTGYCYTAPERAQLAACCDQKNIVLFEDDPYRDIVFDPCERTPVCSSITHAPWIYQGSFSKTLAPGLRLGFLAASRDLIPYLTQLKQAADLHSNRVSQWFVLQQLQGSERASKMEHLAMIYRRKRDAFARALKRHFDDLADWAVPSGGLFFWLALRHAVDTEKLLARAIEQGVAFMPGKPFFAGADRPENTLRLNFSHASETQMDTGLKTLSALVREAMPAAAV